MLILNCSSFFQSITKDDGHSLFSAYLQVLNAELVSIHVNGGEEDGLHLIVS